MHDDQQPSGTQASPNPPKSRSGFLWIVPGLVLGVLVLLFLSRCSTPVTALLSTPPSSTPEDLARKDELAALLKERTFWQNLLQLAPCDLKDELKKQSTKDTPASTPVTTPAVTPTSTMPGGSPSEALAKDDPASLSALQRVEHGTVLVLAPISNGLQQGTGFFVNGDHVVTNRHVIQNAANNEVMVISADLKGARKGTVVASSTGQGFDFAVIRIALQAGDHTLPLPLSRTVNRADKISAWGFPALVSEQDPAYTRLLNGDFNAVPEIVYTDGTVNAVLDTKPRNIVHSAVVSSGNSGGPLVNTKGGVIGINTFIRLDVDSNRQTQTALGSDALMDFLKQNRIAFTEQR